MGPIIVFLILMTALAVFAYFRWPPEYYKDKKAISVYNWSVMALACMVSIAWIFKTKATLAGTINDYWWKPLAFGGALGIVALILAVAFLARNFWIFKPPGNRGF